MSFAGSINAVAPIVLNPNCHTLNVLICTLCLEIPLDPVVTPCHHLFCRNCIRRALQNRSECPNDRVPLTERQLVNINGPLKRIWVQTPVRCPTCNTWKGTLENFRQHVQTCASPQERIKCLEEKLKNSEALANQAIRQGRDLEEKLRQSEISLNQTATSLQEMTAVATKQHSELQLLQVNKMCPTCKPFDTSYRYSRSNVVELTQLICRYLECKPSDVNPNRIYNCIKTCYDDLVRYSDNPSHYETDMRMLLNVCQASNWFTSNQRANIMGWLANRNW
jgi:Zinc finger, C3HC4 type (RING finger)